MCYTDWEKLVTHIFFHLKADLKMNCYSVNFKVFSYSSSLLRNSIIIVTIKQLVGLYYISILLRCTISFSTS